MPLTVGRNDAARTRMTDTKLLVVNSMDPGNEILHDEVERNLKMEYLYNHKDWASRTLDKLLSILIRFQENDLELMALLQDIADTINRQFWIKEVTIGLKDADGKYRYKVMCGLREDAWQAHKKLAYTLEEFTDPKYYKGRRVSKLTKVFLAEDVPFKEDEIDTFTRPILLKAKRVTAEDSIEGDYLDVHIIGKKGEIEGWIEISGTKDGKFPDSVALRWIEVFALIIGTALLYETRGRQGGSGEGRLKSLTNLAHRR
jgi:hypothetical protein